MEHATQDVWCWRLQGRARDRPRRLNERRGLPISFALVVVSGCGGLNARTSSECEELCESLQECGFLPSPLGWADDPASARENCVLRCGNSPVDDPEVKEILACFAGDADQELVVLWCEQPDVLGDESFQDEWKICPRFAQCLEQRVDSPSLLGDVALSVQLVTSADFSDHFAFSVMDWPSVSEQSKNLQSCQPALCDRKLCGSLQCLPSDCDATGSGETSSPDTGGSGASCLETCIPPAGIICDVTSCRVGELPLSGYCEEMGAEKLGIQVYSRGRSPVIDTFHDIYAGINPECGEPTIRINSTSSPLTPGPVVVIARIEGQLLGGALKDVGYFDFPSTEGQEIDDAAATAYCIDMLGPAMIARAGENTVLVPLGDLAALKAREVVWQPCPRST